MIDVAGWYVEMHTVKTSPEIGNHIVWHLPSRLDIGNAIIVCDEPADMLAAFGKRWKQAIRLVERERASTLRPEMREQTARLLKLYRNAHFMVHSPFASIGPTIWLVTPKQLKQPPKNCATIYVACPVDDAMLAAWTARHRRHGAVLLYQIKPG